MLGRPLDLACNDHHFCGDAAEEGLPYPYRSRSRPWGRELSSLSGGDHRVALPDLEPQISRQNPDEFHWIPSPVGSPSSTVKAAKLDQAQLEADELLERLQKEMGSLVDRDILGDPVVVGRPSTASLPEDFGSDSSEEYLQAIEAAADESNSSDHGHPKAKANTMFRAAGRAAMGTSGTGTSTG